jgi:hypothetical protein
MTQQELDRQVARATGEPLCSVRQRGFGIADPLDVGFDPEPSGAPQWIDWDQVHAMQPVRRFRRRRRPVCA